jgi:hypothetical protein
MAIDPQYLDWFNTVVTLENANGSSSGGYGGRKYASPALSVRARIEQYIVRVKAQGMDVFTKARLFVAPFSTAGTSAGVTVRVGDRITIPTSDVIIGTSAQPRIIDVLQMDDELSKAHHFEVLI